MWPETICHMLCPQKFPGPRPGLGRRWGLLQKWGLWCEDGPINGLPWLHYSKGRLDWGRQARRGASVFWGLVSIGSWGQHCHPCWLTLNGSAFMSSTVSLGGSLPSQKGVPAAKTDIQQDFRWQMVSLEQGQKFASLDRWEWELSSFTL